MNRRHDQVNFKTKHFIGSCFSSWWGRWHLAGRHGAGAVTRNLCLIQKHEKEKETASWEWLDFWKLNAYYQWYTCPIKATSTHTSHTVHQLQIKHSYLWAYVSNSLSSHHSHSKSHSHRSLDFSPLSVNIYWHILSLLTHVLWLVYSFPKSTMDGDLNPSNFEPCIWGLWCPSTVLSLLNQWIKPILN